MVMDASAIPAANAGQKLRPSLLAKPMGMKNGNPRRTSTSDSRASLEIRARSWLEYHVFMKAKMLTRGRVSSKSPSRGQRLESSPTPMTTGTRDKPAQNDLPHS
jgi:hypothetical protein